MHTNPFTSTGYDLSDLQRKIDQKAGRNEIYSLRSALDRLESSVRELRSENDSLRHRCERMAETLRELNPGLATVDGY